MSLRSSICQELQPQLRQGRKESERLTKITMNRILETHILFFGYVEEICEERKQFISVSSHLGKRSDLPFLQHSCR